MKHAMKGFLVYLIGQSQMAMETGRASLIQVLQSATPTAVWSTSTVQCRLVLELFVTRMPLG